MTTKAETRREALDAACPGTRADDFPEGDLFAPFKPLFTDQELKDMAEEAREKKFQPRAPDLLETGAATFRERNATYGDTYLNFGVAAAAMFPDGLHIPAGDIDGFNRLGVFVQCVSKVMRYGPNLSRGGHSDSAHDLMVYAAMLEEVTR